MAGKEDSLVPGELFVFLEALAQERVPFVVIGAAALALHGIPRSTLDVDLVLPAQGTAVRTLFRVAHQTGFRSREGALVKLAHRPEWLSGQWATFRGRQGMPWVDVFFERPPVFERLRRRALRRIMAGRSVAVASLAALERMKREVGRPIDLADVALIQERRKRRR